MTERDSIRCIENMLFNLKLSKKESGGEITQDETTFYKSLEMVCEMSSKYVATKEARNILENITGNKKGI